MTTQYRWRSGLAVMLGATLSAVSFAQPADVTTWKNAQSRSGANTKETVLAPANVNVTTFGKLFQATVDGDVDAQPLVVTGVAIAGGIHSVVYAATEHDTIYALDANNGSVYAQVSLIPSGGSTVRTGNAPETGIMGTPVIDPANNTLYAVATSKVNGTIVQYLHALDIATLAEKTNSPVAITARVTAIAGHSSNTGVTFDPATEQQRPGLLLEQGHIVISWTPHCAQGRCHGWAMSYDASSLKQDGAQMLTRVGQAADAINAPVVWNGMFYAYPHLTGVAAYVASSRSLNPTSRADSIATDPTTFSFVAGNPALSAGAHHPDWGIINPPVPGARADNPDFGGLNPVPGEDADDPTDPTVFGFVVRRLVLSPSALVSQTNVRMGTLSSQDVGSLSANGTTHGIYWLMHSGTLYAFDATDLSTELWDSDQDSGRDRPGSSAGFSTPTIANGMVYIGTSGTSTPGQEQALVGYGLLNMPRNQE